MVSFQCEACGDVLTKKKLDPHRNRCRGATFTCIDCMVHFYGTDYRSHTSCMTEEQKYQGALYKNKKAKTTDNAKPPAHNNNSNNNGNMAHRAYVEDVVDYEGWEDAEGLPPRAPTPPAPGDLNVFQFMNNPTPTASTVALPRAIGPSEAEPSERNQLVRFEEPQDYDDFDAEMMADDEALITYGVGPIPDGHLAYETPLPKAARERKRSDKSSKKDKKRKRLHVDTHDLDMPDAPVLHTGLTGGLNRMMSRPHAFPPSPDYSGSGGELGETPASPLKKSKQSKHHRSSRHEGGSIGNNLFSMLTSGSTKAASKPKKRKHASGTTSSKKRHSSHHHSKRLEGAQEPKLLEYARDDGGESRSGSGAMVVFGHGADLFFSMVNKGPDSERGCSVNKALKRFHRERGGAGDSLPKPLAEKELFRSLRMRRNDRGEIVLFCA